MLVTFAGAIGAAQLALAQTASAQAVSEQTASAPSPWYIEGSAGALWRFDASKSTTFFNALGATGPGTNTATFDPGYVMDLGVGYRLPLGFRVEVEGGYTHYTLDTVSPLSTNGVFPELNGSRLTLQSGGGLDQYFATFNGFYDLPMFGWIVPYLGGGVGVNYTHSETATFTIPSGFGVAAAGKFTQLGGSETNTVVVAEVGVAFTLDAHWSIVPSYRYEKVFVNSRDFPNQANIFKLGLRYSL